MKLLTTNVLIITLLCLLTGCPYESEHSLGQIQNIDPNLIKTWKGKQINFEDDEWIIEVTDFNDKEYLVDLKIRRKGAVQSYKMRAFVSKIGSNNILHFQSLMPPTEHRTFNYIKYRLESEKLVVRFLKKNDETRRLNSKNELSKYIMRNLNDEKAWSKSIILKK
ncbi:hypothetical protein BKI52_06540 [marine bacterium AO1-C]|nr:hypothetical protein BKI52_06540 [marine bacterium AO1-C]